VPPQSVAVAYRRDVFGRVGYFDEAFDACEDVEFNHRLSQAGGQCYFAPQLAVHYHPRATLAGLVYQMLRYGRGRARLLLKHPNTFSIPSLVPAVFLLALAGSFVLGLFAPPFAALFCLTALAYGLAVSLGGVAVALRRQVLQLAPLMPAVFVSIHVGAGWGVLTGLAPALLRRGVWRLAPLARGIRV
jgi:hypothetical protein